MKARIKKTGEIINIADYAAIELDKCDSYGNPICLKPEEIELIQEVSEDKHWQDVRERAAIAAMQGMLRTFYERQTITTFSSMSVKNAVHYADELVRQLKGE